MSIPQVLYHYTQHMGTLCSIIESGYWPKYSRENIEWLDFAGDKELGLPMVCFCDIPINRISQHSRIFGYYGLGMSIEWANKKEISPVHYIRRNSSVAFLYQGLKTNSQEELKRLTAYTQNYDYISESEWRYVPDKPGVPGYVIDQTLYNQNRLDFFNQITRSKAMLHFGAFDIKYIIVKFNAEIPLFRNWLSSKHNPLLSSILSDKIVSCESFGQV